MIQVWRHPFVEEQSVEVNTLRLLCVWRRQTAGRQLTVARAEAAIAMKPCVAEWTRLSQARKDCRHLAKNFKPRAPRSPARAALCDALDGLGIQNMPQWSKTREDILQSTRSWRRKGRPEPPNIESLPPILSVVRLRQIEKREIAAQRIFGGLKALLVRKVYPKPKPRRRLDPDSFFAEVSAPTCRPSPKSKAGPSSVQVEEASVDLRRASVSPDQGRDGTGVGGWLAPMTMDDLRSPPESLDTTQGEKGAKEQGDVGGSRGSSASFTRRSSLSSDKGGPRSPQVSKVEPAAEGGGEAAGDGGSGDDVLARARKLLQRQVGGSPATV